MAAEKRPALGRGLSALIPETANAAHGSGRDFFELDIDLLAPNPYQPRQTMDEQGLGELAQSMKSNGVIQPILVRKVGDRYEIIAGERRWRAAQIAGLLKVPVVVRDVPDDRLLQLALIENIQRESLNPIDEAHAYRRLLDEFGMTQEALATAVGKDRASVANYLRLLRLPDDVQQEVATGNISMGHARAIVALEAPALVRRAVGQILGRRLSVRDTEALVRRLQEPEKPARAQTVDVHTRHAEEVLKLALGTRVRIARSGKGGRIEIDFVSEEELNRIYEYITART